MYKSNYFYLQKIPVAAVSRQRTGQEDPDVFRGFTGTDTFVLRRAKHSSSSRSLPGLCTFAHNGSLHEAGFSKSAPSRCPPFSEFPTKLVDWMIALYPHLPRLSIGLWKKLQIFLRRRRAAFLVDRLPFVLYTESILLSYEGGEPGCPSGQVVRSCWKSRTPLICSRPRGILVSVARRMMRRLLD